MEKEYALTKEYTGNISIEEVNGCIRTILKDKDRDIIIVAPEKDKNTLPDQAQVNAWITTIGQEKLAQWKEELPGNGLMANMPAPGKVTGRERADSLGVTILTLSNGVKVWIKPTQFKNEEIVFGAFSEGGTSLYPDSLYMNASGAGNLVAGNGLGAFTPIDLGKMLAGKSVQVQPYIQERYEGINGATTPKDLETALQLTYLYFTNPRNDASLFNNNISRTKAGMANRGNSPEAAFSDTANLVLGGNHYRRQSLTPERLDAINPDKAYAIYKERFANAADFTFVFTGSIDTATFIPLIERYLGSLPSGGATESAKDLGIHIPEGQINKTVYKGKDNKAVVRLLYSGTYTFSEANNIQLTALGTVLQYRMTERIREGEGGAYSPRAGVSYNKLPQSRYAFTIQFTCAPGNVEKLVAAVNDEISKIKNGGVTADDISKFAAEQTRTTELQLQSNQFWMGYLSYVLQNNEPATGIFQFKEELKTVTPKTVQQAAQQYITDNNCIRLVLQPEAN
jgi:zinc protease